MEFKEDECEASKTPVLELPELDATLSTTNAEELESNHFDGHSCIQKTDKTEEWS